MSFPPPARVPYSYASGPVAGHRGCPAREPTQGRKSPQGLGTQTVPAPCRTGSRVVREGGLEPPCLWKATAFEAAASTYSATLAGHVPRHVTNPRPLQRQPDRGAARRSVSCHERSQRRGQSHDFDLGSWPNFPVGSSPPGDALSTRCGWAAKCDAAAAAQAQVAAATALVTVRWSADIHPPSSRLTARCLAAGSAGYAYGPNGPSGCRSGRQRPSAYQCSNAPQTTAQ